MGDVVRILDQYGSIPLGNGMTIAKCGEWTLTEGEDWAEMKYLMDYLEATK